MSAPVACQEHAASQLTYYVPGIAFLSPFTSMLIPLRRVYQAYLKKGCGLSGGKKYRYEQANSQAPDLRNAAMALAGYSGT